jgi:hypothetical protein
MTHPTQSTKHKTEETDNSQPSVAEVHKQRYDVVCVELWLADYTQAHTICKAAAGPAQVY